MSIRAIEHRFLSIANQDLFHYRRLKRFERDTDEWGMSPESASLVSPSKQSARESSHKSGPRVLIIDEDPQVAHVTRFILSRSGFDAITASSAEEGLRLAVQMRPGVIICDAALPHIRGSKLLPILKATAETAAIPVIIVSGNEGLNCPGIFTFLRKPFDSATLIGATRNALQAELHAA